MAFSSSLITIADATKPCLLAAHALADTSDTTARWNNAGTTTDTDLTDANWPASNAWDAFAHIKTQATGNLTDAQDKYFVFWSPGGVFPDFDYIVISHPLRYGDTANAAIFTCRLEIADDAAFSVNLTDIGNVGVFSASTRTYQSTLTHSGGARRYSNVQYARLKFDKSSGTDFRLQINEIWLGRRRELPRFPDEPWDKTREVSIVSDSDSRSGVATRYTRSRGRAIRNVRMTLDTAAQWTEIRSWWSECKQGTRPFWWMHQHTPSDPLPLLMWAEDAALMGPLSGAASRREFMLNMREQAPYEFEDAA